MQSYFTIVKYFYAIGICCTGKGQYGRYRLAPLFDHGLSLVCRCHNSVELKKFDVMEDRRVQAFIGSESVRENMRYVPKRVIRGLPKLQEKDMDILFEDLNGILSKEYQNKIREMIRRRWQSLGDI